MSQQLNGPFRALPRLARRSRERKITGFCQRCDNIRIVTAPPLKSAEPDSPLLCGGCGHNLFGASGRCPECGRAFDPNRLIGELIPWEQRKYAGYVRTYIRTAFLATFRPREIARRVDSPVSYRAARAFRRITILIGFVPLLLTALSVRDTVTRLYWDSEWAPLFQNQWSFGTLLLGLLLGISAAAHLGGWFFYRRALPLERRGRAYAIGCYAAAPLVLLPVPILTVWMLWIVPMPESGNWITFRIVVVPFLIFPSSVLLLVLSVYKTTLMLRVACGYGVRRVAIPAVLLPIGWVVAFAGGPIVMELLLAFAVVLVRSFA